MRLFTFSKPFLFLVTLVFSLEASMVSRTQVIMGTFISISLEETNQKHFENSFTLFRGIDSTLSSYKPTADIYKLNLNRTTSLHKDTFEALQLSEKYYADTNGYFDVTIGSITKDLFAFGEEERIPMRDELSKAFVDISGLDFNQTRASIAKGIKIDLGGIGKGYGVDKVVAYLESENINKGIIAASGDIRCLDACQMKVQDPFSDDGIIASFETLEENTGISTSGNYNRYVQTTKNNHLINPKKKKSQNTFVSLTLVSKLPSSELDAYATAASVMPRDKAYEFLNKHKLGYIILEVDGKMVYSESLFRFVKDLSIKYTHKK